VPLINSAPARAQLIREGFGIDSVIFLQFTEETMRIPWTDFIQALRTELGAVHFVVGHDFRFGWHGEGTAEKLTAYCAENGLGCDVISQITLDGVPISSSYIRQLLLDGRIREANRFLGHPHVLIDVVRYGYRLGSRLGAPTINMRFPKACWRSGAASMPPRCGFPTETGSPSPTWVCGPRSAAVKTSPWRAISWTFPGTCTGRRCVWNSTNICARSGVLRTFRC
jgi:hypothetical protein